VPDPVDRFDKRAADASTRAVPVRPRWSPARLAYWFYAVAASGAVAGQTWVALAHVPWPPGTPAVVRVLAVLPFALCLELLAMALSAMADERMRLGERAYGFRFFSAAVAVVAVGILVAGHWPHLYWSAAFGLLSGSAYLLWLLHSAARRRDSLRAAGKLADTAPDYGLWRRVRHPVWTARAAELARQGRVDPQGAPWRPLGLYESLHAARVAMRAERRRPALSRAVAEVVRADQRDPLMAAIAVRTLDLDRLATELEARVDYDAWSARLAGAVTAAPPAPAACRDDTGPVSVSTGGGNGADTGSRQAPGNAVAASSGRRRAAARRRPTAAAPGGADPPATVPRAGAGAGDVAPANVAEAVAWWRARHPDMPVREVCARVGRSERTVRRILDGLPPRPVPVDAPAGDHAAGAGGPRPGANGATVTTLAGPVTSG